MSTVEDYYCEECGKTTGKLYQRTEREQEYAGASVWTFTYFICPECEAKQNPRMQQPIMENTRGF